MRVLLDTHTLLWAMLTPDSVSSDVASILSNESNVICVSAASAWEIATKVRLGKLREAEIFEKEFMEAIDDAGYWLLPIEVEDALRAGRLAGDHRDPFDRMIAARALGGDIPVLSNDARLDSFGVRRIW